MARLADDVRSIKPLTYDEQRECESSDCAKRLTRYNPGPFCYQHTSKFAIR